MKILLTGATGYIGKRLLPVLIAKGHTVVACVRDAGRFHPPKSLEGKINIIEADFLDSKSLLKIPKDIQAAYYLMHSMSNEKDYTEKEFLCASNFRKVISATRVKHVIYLGGIVNNKKLSKHLGSRKIVERVLSGGGYVFTGLRAGIIIGSGSASYEIIRDLVEKLPVMIAPKWLNTQCQPIAIGDVITFLISVLNDPYTFDKNFDIGGPDVLSYKKMLLEYARIRGLKRKIFTLPIMTPRLSSYWLYFVTATSYKLSCALVDSMKVEVVCRFNQLGKLLNITPMSYPMAIEKTLEKTEGNDMQSSWKDAWISSRIKGNLSDFTQVPSFGCLVDKRSFQVKNQNNAVEKVFSIGGKNGWYYANWLWKIRGFIDKLSGGVGLRRGKTQNNKLQAGDALDFWRVLYANKQEGRLLLYAEMKLPGEAWLEFKLQEESMHQIATFRPKGLLGRLYWYLLLPFHKLIFRGMLKRICGL